MKHRQVFFSALIALGAMPFAAQANGSDAAADACIQAFVDTYLPKDHPVQIRKVASFSSPLVRNSKRYTIELSARLTSSETEFVTARCTANAAGQVLDLDGSPSNETIAAAGARQK